MPAVGHVHLKVSDLERSEAFYREALGLEVTERVGGSFVFMSFGESHHHLALQGHPAAEPADPDGHGVEVYCDTRDLRHRPEWEGIAALLDVDALTRE